MSLGSRPEPDSTMQSRGFLISSLVVLTLLALGLRLYRLSNQSFWTDEVLSLIAARTPMDRIYEESAKTNNCLPTYFLILRAVVGASGTDIEFRARLLSAVAGALSVPVFAIVVYLWRRHSGAAFAAGVLLALNPLHIWYSQEVRAYAMMLFFGLLSLLAFERARASNGWGWRAAYIFCAAFAVLLHKTGMTFPLACAAWHMIDCWRRGRSKATQPEPPLSSREGAPPRKPQYFRELRFHAPVFVVLAIMLLLKAYPPTKEHGRPSSILELAYTAMTFIGGYSFGPSPTEIQNYGPMAALRHHPVQVAVVLLVLLGTALVFATRFRNLLCGKESGLLLLGVGIVTVAALVTRFPYNVRYTLPALFGFLGLVAALGIGSKTVVGRLVFTTVVFVNLWADGQWYFQSAYRKGDSRAVAQWLRNNEQQVHSWTVLPNYLASSIQWYVTNSPYILSGYLPPEGPQTTTFPPVPDVLIIGRRHHLTDPDRVVSDYRTAGGATTISSIAGFELYTRIPQQALAPKTPASEPGP
jgi:hypothetical protein